jgi:flagellar hook-associated protein 1
MGSLTSLLSLAQNALDANQAAINITANNVANQSTPGYTREVATWQESDSISIGGGATVSAGAEVSAVSQRNRVLDQRVEQQTQAQSASSTESSALAQLQSIFGLSSTTTSASSTTIGSDVDAFFNSLNTLQASPSDSSARQGVLSAAATLASDLNSASSQMASQTNSLNQQVMSVTAQVNTLTTSIAALNLQISAASPTGDAGTLEDQRQEDLTQLSQYIGFNQTTTQDNGITLSTANGALLVSEGQSFALSTSMTGGNVDVVASNGQDITSGITGGQLGGAIETRDGALATASNALDSLAYAIGSAVNTQNAAGADANGVTGREIFSGVTSEPGAAASIGMATTNPDYVAAAAVGEGSSGGTNATALNALGQAALVGGQTAAGFFASFLTQVGTAAASASDNDTVQQASLTQLTTQQSSLEGVSLDDEASNLTEYQRSYEAAAKVFSIVDELMASALNLGEETTVS